MAKKKSSETTTTKPKLDLSRTLEAIDLRDKEYYHNLTDDEKKSFAPIVLMRFVSSAEDKGNIHEYYLNAINDIINDNFWSLAKHPELQYKLLSMSGIGVKKFHTWIANSKRHTSSTNMQEFLNKVYPGMNFNEFKLFVSINSIDDFKDICIEQGLQDNEIKSLVELFEKLKTNNVSS